MGYKLLQDEMGIDVGFTEGFPLKLIMIMNTHYVLSTRLSSLCVLTYLISSKTLREVLSLYSFHI